VGADRALRRLDAAAQRAERAGDVGAFINLAHTRYRLARKAGGASDLASLVADTRAAADRLRGRFRSRGGRLWAAQQLDATLADFLADDLAEGELDPGTFRDVETLKARVLLDALQDTRTGEGAFAVPSDEANRLETALMRFAAPAADQDDVMWSELRLASLLPIGGPWEEGERLAQLGSLEAEYAGLGLPCPKIADVAPLARVQQALASNEAIVEYVVARRGGHPLQDVWALVITNQSARVAHVAAEESFATADFVGSVGTDARAPIDFTPLGGLVVQARVAARNGDESTAAARLADLSRLLLHPLFEQGLLSTAHERLVLVPHRVLHYVPYGALSGVDGRALVEDFAVTFAPSATVWEHVRSRARPPASRFVGVANPRLDYTKLPPLDESMQELEAIVRRLPIACETRVAGEATESFLRTSSAGAGVVHIATHGDFPEDDALDMQRILLAADAVHDGPLRAEELRRLDLSETRILVLSVCNGGIYRFGPGDEPYGLVPAALEAGAENVIGTLWPIEDDIGRLFMKELYRDLLEAGPAEALRRTALQFRDDGALIRQWSAFRVVGSGNAFESVAPVAADPPS
jgi:hypothetical protein